MLESIKNSSFSLAIKKHRKIIDFSLYSLVFLSLFFSCFFQNFAYVAVAIICLSSLFFFNIEKNLCLLLIISCFNPLLNTTKIGLSGYTNVFISFVVCLPYVISLIKRQKKLNFKLLIPILLFLIYIVLPIHTVSLKNIVNVIKIYGLMYVVYECRKEISVKNIIKFFAISLLLACLFALFRSVSPRLERFMPYVTMHKYLRFSALYGHPNSLAVYAAVAISGLLFLRYKNKISLPLFFVLFIPILCFGFCTLSRNFYLVIAVAFVVFAIFHIVKTKKNFWKLGLSIFLAVLLCCGMCFTETKIMLVRFKVLPYGSISSFIQNSDVGPTKNDGDKYTGEGIEKFSDEWWEGVYNGEIWYDPGRTGIAKNYLKVITSSAKNILFGKGISAPEVGRMGAHNMFIQELYNHGLVGMLFYLVFLLSIINFKKLKNWKMFLSLSILILPYIAMVMFEAQTNDVTSFIMFTVAIGLIEKEIIEKANKVQKRVLICSSFNNEDNKENIMAKVIECSNKDNFTFDILVNSNKTENLPISEENIGICYLGETPTKKCFNAFKYLVNKGEIYDAVHIDGSIGKNQGIFAYVAKDFGGIENIIISNLQGNKVNKFLANNFADCVVTNLTSKKNSIEAEIGSDKKLLEDIYKG